MDLTTATTNVDAPLADVPPAEDGCPRCGKTLIDPSGLGWCRACGYCKSLADDPSQRLLEEKRKASLGGLVEAGGAVSGLPIWFWACFLFLAIGIIFGIVMDRRLPAGDNLDRAAWATAQIGVGLLLIFFAQLTALVTIAPEEPTLTYKDILFSAKLWGGVFKRLPRCKECLWTAILGIGLILGSALFIGGFQHWFTYLPKSSAQQAKEKARSNSSPGEIIALPVE